MLNAVRRLLGREPAVPAKRLSFSRPLVLLQSDDWGRVGVRDREVTSSFGPAEFTWVKILTTTIRWKLLKT